MTTRPLSPLTMLLSRHTRRREFLGFLGGMAAASIYRPRAARAQPKVRRLGGLSQGSTSTHPTPRVRTLPHGLRHLGWGGGQNPPPEWRFSPGRAQPPPPPPARP